MKNKKSRGMPSIHIIKEAFRRNSEADSLISRCACLGIGAVLFWVDLILLILEKFGIQLDHNDEYGKSPP